MATPNITDWISAISTAALGVLGAFITIWQWRMTRFRPKLSSRIDAEREAIEVWIVNKGRASGIIDRIQILRPDPKNERQAVIEREAVFEGFPGNEYRPVSLSAMASMRIIIQAPPPDVKFDAGTQVTVGVGRAEPKVITLTEMTSEEGGLFGVKSVLPPGASRILQREAQELAQLPSAARPPERHPSKDSAGSAEQTPDS
jgi:hypothetical protein